MADEPLPIRRLQESLINRIAAGEIIHRPASALKELIENCLDAGATSIRVTVKDGGMKLLQIQDNGCGIRRSDLAILAERFTTSKLSTFSDLSRIKTYGFRGELAAYSDSVLVSTASGLSSDPKPCAGNDGTTITIENLFFNTPTRLAALRSYSEEYARILDVMTKYAVHNSRVSFVCKKAGSPSSDLSTPSSSSTAQAIRLLYGNAIAKDLLNTSLSSKEKVADDVMEEDEDEDDPEAWTAEVHFTNPHYQGKKMVLLIFINHRLVESTRMKRAFEAVYTSVLPKGSSPFIYLSLEIDPRSVDVNVHPTKKEVHFLNEDAIVEKISDGLQTALVGQSHSKVFEYQTLLTGGIAQLNAESKKRKGKERAVDSEGSEEEMEREGPSSSTVSDAKKKVASQHKVRISQKDRTLDSMFPVVNPARIDEPGDPPETGRTTRDIKESKCTLVSIGELRATIMDGKHIQLSDILGNHIFVGIVDMTRSLSLVQHSTKLYLVNHDSLAEELFYQLGVRQFGDFTRLKLEPAPPLKMLIELAVDAEKTSQSSLSKPEIVQSITETLMSRRVMLGEYFSLQISEEGKVESLPLLLREYTPNLDKLPGFLMRLGPQVDWTSEVDCFDTFLRELAYFYTPGPLSPTDEVSSEEQSKSDRWQVQHVLFPAVQRYLVPPKTLLDRDVVQLANLPDLYKVFERC